METVDIGLPAMVVLYGVTLLPALLLRAIGLKIARDLAWAIARMTAQLAILGLYLEYLFALNHPWLNAAWIALMLIAADLTILARAGLRWRLFFASTLAAVSLGVLFSSGYLLGLVIRPQPLYDARYLIPLIGMILGNCLQSNVIGLERFYTALRKHQTEYLTYLLLGASRTEAVRPYFRQAMLASVNPAIASMATMGLVWLPGMMTGQILGGSDPWVAVKYQIAIMLSILVSMTLTNSLGLWLSLRIAFDRNDVLRPEIFKPQAVEAR
jgi:putative ABC transport system permease protein